VPTSRTDIDLDPAAIRADAEAASGMEGWDDADIDEPLTLLTETLEREAKLHDSGRAGAARRLRDLMTSYLRVLADRQQYPEIDNEKIEEPIVIVGLPRSGTTLLHGLLAADSRLRAPAFWEALMPSPPPEAANYDSDPRRDVVQAQFDEMIARNPSLVAQLPYSADLKAECNTIAQPTLRSVAFTAYYHVPSYQEWYLAADHEAMYRYHRMVLQQLQWRGPRGRWMLKAPPHLLTMERLVARYPTARLIQTHRDPKAVMPSNCALFMANRVLHTNDVDRRKLGAESLELWATGCERTEAFRAEHPEVEMIDVHYDETVRDPIGVVERIYDVLGIEFVPAERAAMERWLKDNARENRPVEQHALEEFGLSPAQVDERFAGYRAAHGLE
jgi:hypothetical protein